MKVLWFTNTPCNADEYFNSELKGTGGWLKSLDKEMQQKVDLHVAFYTKKKENDFLYKATNYYPIQKFSKLRQKFKRLLNLPWYIDDLNKYLSIIEKVNPDIIHIHGTELPFIAILNQVDIPIVVSIQGNTTVCHHKIYSGIEKKYVNSSIFKKIMTHYKNEEIGLKNKSLIEKKYLKHCKSIIGRTDWDRRITRIMSPQSSYYHNDEILRDGFYKNEWRSKTKDRFVIFTTSGGNIYKGFETICQSLNLLNRLDIEIHWRVAGISSTNPIVRITKKKLKDNFPIRNLELLGKLNESDLISELLESDVYVMPSHIENSPNNLCEAMILGMPCIATYAGGTSSLLDDGKEGILIQDGDPWSMAGAILEMKNNYNVAIGLGQNAKERALIRHNKKEIVNSICKIYSLVLKK